MKHFYDEHGWVAARNGEDHKQQIPPILYRLSIVVCYPVGNSLCVELLNGTPFEAVSTVLWLMCPLLALGPKLVHDGCQVIGQIHFFDFPLGNSCDSDMLKDALTF